MKYTAFLRAVNVSGHNPVKMDLLKKVFIDKGYEEVTTYLQSGNIVFESNKQKNGTLEAQLEGFILDRLKLEVSVFVKSKDDIASLVSRNPFLDDRHEEAFIHLTFFKGDIKDIQMNVIEKIKMQDEEYVIMNNHIYLYCPNGYGRTKLNNAAWEKWGKCTTRNWNTIKAINSLMRR